MILPQETRKTSNRQPNFTRKTTAKRITKKLQSQQKERNHKDQSRNKKETVVKMNKAKSWFTEMINKIDKQPVSSRKKGRRIKSTKLEMQKREEQTTEIYKRS